MKVENTARPIVGTISGTIRAKDNFLPQAGFTFDVGDEHQIFGSYAENLRAFISAATGAAPFSTTQAGFDAIRNTLKPERSRTLEAGWRIRSGSFDGVIAAYDVKFKNRLLVISQGPGIIGAPNALSNVGSVSSQGVEAGGRFSLTDTVSLSGSLSFNDAKYDDNTVDGLGQTTATGGKRVVDAPKVLAKGELAYDDQELFGRVGVSHTGKRFYTYLNDASVKSYTLVDIALGYRFSGDDGWADGLEIQANLSNALDRNYVSTIGSNGFGNSDPTGAAHPQVKPLLSDDHFSVDGTLIEAWASQKSFRPKDGSDDGDGANFHGQKRKNDTHASTTDPESRLYRKAAGREAKLSYMGHATMENRHGLAVAGKVTPANGTAERRAAEAMLKARRKAVGHGITAGEDKAYDTSDHVAALRALGVTPHVTQNVTVTKTGRHRRSAIDGRTTRHEGYGMSQSRRAMIECIFGWGKQHGTMRKTKHRGLARVAADFLLNLIGYNLIRIPKLVAT